MKFEISYDDIIVMRDQYKRIMRAQEIIDYGDTIPIKSPIISVAYNRLVNRLSNEYNERLKIGETKRRIK